MVKLWVIKITANPFTAALTTYFKTIDAWWTPKAEVDLFKKDGAVLIKGKFDNAWIEKLKVGINKAKINPSPRFTNHTKDEKLLSYLEDF